MLVRAIGRRQATRQTSTRDVLSSPLLPFLCPALARWTTTQASHGPSVPSRHPTSPKPQRRRLASVAGDVSTLSATAPYNHSTEPSTLGDHHPHLTWDYPLGNPTSSNVPYQPLMLHHERDPEHSARPAPSRNGIGGTTAELLSNIYTCLRVNRYDRVEACIDRLADQPSANAAELAYAKQIYLEARFANLSSGNGPYANFAAMRRWFSYKIARKSLTLDLAAAVPFFRAALCVHKATLETRYTGPGAIDKQLIRRYIRRSGVSVDELIHDPNLTLHESQHLSRIMDSKNNPPADPQSAETQVYQETVMTSTPRYTVSPEDMPEVLKIDQKGVGLASLQQGLLAIDQHKDKRSARKLTGDALQLRNTEREMLIEASASAAAVARWKAEEEKLHGIIGGSNLRSRPIGAMMWTWYSALLPVMQSEIAEIMKVLDPKNKSSSSDERLKTGPYLESIPPETLASTTILYVMNMLGRGKDRETDQYSPNLKLTMLATGLGKQMQYECNAEATRKKTNSTRWYKNRAFSKGKHTSRIGAHVEHDWPLSIKARIGALLLSRLIETATIPITREHPRSKEKVTQLQPAFSHRTVYRLGKKQGFLLACPDLIQKLHREPVGGLICKKLPMVVVPKPWTDFAQGGYLTYSTDFIRFPPTDKTPRDYAMAAIERGDLQSIFDAMNILSSIPWKIHKDILRIQIKAWNSGDTVGCFAPLDPVLELPPEPPHSSDPNVRRIWMDNIQEIKNKQAGLHSLRCHQNLQLETARAFRNEIIYLPHNIDFRGRAYPIPPYLNHMGADNTRALVIFAKGKPLGVNGLRWLKIHLANVSGNDKASFQEREDFVMEHLVDVYDSAENPLEGRRWWAKSEDAWQTLAACIELRNALESPDLTQFVSHLPIHQDGTCNGLQHYAALGGDEVGARQVNLEPSDKPSDVYTAVAEAVREKIEQDIATGDPRAMILHGHIGRRIVKQPVMTNVYGVTEYGVKAQVCKQLEEIFPERLKTETINHLKLAEYIASKISTSLNEMFNGAQAIQEWFGKCADRITSSVSPQQIDRLRKSLKEPSDSKKKPKAIRNAASTAKALFKSPVIWTTPLRLPVVQPYRTPKRSMVKTTMQSFALQEPQLWDPINKRKQLQAFPPNFIHSLDASHMMLSAIKCAERGMTFASIHDSFWTHACDIDGLSEVLRDAFVDMHGENIIGRLREEFVTRYKGNMYLAGVQADSKVGKNIKKVQQSTLAERRAVSKEMDTNLLLADLLIEQDRIRLLGSDDPDERARGEAMVTPGSVLDPDLDESAFAMPVEITSTMLGTAPEVDSSDPSEKADNMLTSDSSTLVTAAEPSDAAVQAKSLAPTRRASYYYKTKKVYVWLPMAFPAIPPKGTFDVTRLKESRYFFN